MGRWVKVYIIDQENNAVTPISKRTFSELGFKERDHLQEWIAKRPEILGEELLIIQKEFDGWTETRERLDLLALDKNGNLVVIENKLDDSGKDVVWQSLKYAAYCSTLKKSDVADIFEKYRRGVDSEQTAKDIITEFLDAASFEEASVNEGSGQRIILTGAKFRPEVTATCLWLINYQVDIQCIRIVPFGDDGKLFLNVEHIIPPPEADDFMVKVGSKEVSEKSSRGELRNSQKKRLAFYSQLLQKLTHKAQTCFANRSTTKDHWLSGGTGISSVNYNFHFLQDRVRFELYISKADAAENKAIFDFLFEHKAKIENDFNGELDWRRLPELKASRIFYEYLIDAYDEKNWDEAIDWLNKYMNIGITTFQPLLNQFNKT